jgi:hypothetical protein
MTNITVIADYNKADLALVDSLAAPKLTEFIVEYEPKILKSILGYPLYKLFVAAEIIEGDLYDKILTGCDYTDNTGLTLEWEGLKSILVPFITFFYLRWNEKKASQGGEFEAKFDNGIKTNNVSEQCIAWNDGIENANILREYLIINLILYPSYDNTKDEYIETINIFDI